MPLSHYHLRVASRLSLSGYSGSAGRQSSLVLQGTNFSTRDADNDNCLCKCAQMLSGGGCKMRWTHASAQAHLAEHPHRLPTWVFVQPGAIKKWVQVRVSLTCGLAWLYLIQTSLLPLSP